MISLEKYIKESLLDKMGDLAKAQDKAIIQEIKNWVKTNIRKGSGRIKIDSKTGAVTLPSNTSINIHCPIANNVYFEEFEPESMWLFDATEEDLAAICGKIDKKHEYGLRLQYLEAKTFPEELDGMSGELSIDTIRHDLDFNDINLHLSSFCIEGRDIKVAGTKNINIISSGNYDYFTISGVTMMDDLGVIDGPKSKLFLNKVRGKKTLLCNLKSINTLTLEDCSEFDLSKCDCNYLYLWGIDDSFNYDFLPKKLNTLNIRTTEEYSSFDLSKIKSKVENLIINDSQVDLNVSPEERNVLYDFGSMTANKNKIDEIPQSLIEYIEKNAKSIKDFDGMTNGKDYITLSKSAWKKDGGKLEVISYFKNFQKVEVDRSALNRGIEIETEGWVSSWRKDSMGRWTKYFEGGSQGLGHKPLEAEPERFYKNKNNVYYIDHYMIFEIPAGFKPFIEKIMVEA